jgi:hypothetical protein
MEDPAQQIAAFKLAGYDEQDLVVTPDGRVLFDPDLAEARMELELLERKV